MACSVIVHEALGDWLLTVPIGTTTVMFGGDPTAVRVALAAAELAVDGRLGLLFPCRDTRPAEAVVEQAANALASAALKAFPHWYRMDSLAGIGRTSLDAAMLDAALRAIQTSEPEMSPLWSRRAFCRALAGQPPRDDDVARASELRQLALAVNAGALTLIPVFTTLPGPTEIPGLIRGLEWLACHSGAAVVALLPGSVEDAGNRFDRLDCVVLARPDAALNGATVSDASPDASPEVIWAGPIAGRPHWASAAEQQLAAALAADTELRPLFAFNQTVTTCRGGRPRVDLLWRTGRLVVEIDGYADHATREAFRRDRQRDYELTISGYLVVRLTADEVLTDPLISLDKLRDAVRFRNLNEMSEISG